MVWIITPRCAFLGETECSVALFAIVCVRKFFWNWHQDRIQKPFASGADGKVTSTKVREQVCQVTGQHELALLTAMRMSRQRL